uniref:Luciferase n=1 Tax=Vargula hilgendorfii TaxID=6674 RepID=A0A3G9EGJ8_VARHI|nr:luciferase [Vargula hilgendorfii]
MKLIVLSIILAYCVTVNCQDACPVEAEAPSSTPTVPTSCEAKEGECIDTRCATCKRDILSDGLCENKPGKTCCRMCQYVIECRVEAAGYFRTFYGKRFNFQEPGKYVLARGTKGGDWSVTLTMENLDGQKGAVLTKTTLEVAGDVIDITQAIADPITVNGGADPVIANPFTIGEVTIAVVEIPGFNITVIEFFKLIVIDILGGRSVRIAPDTANKGLISGICGNLEMNDADDFTTDADQLAIQPNINKEFDGCPFYGNPSDIEYCKGLMEPYRAVCRNNINFYYYTLSCAFAYCMGGEERAKHVLFDYVETCAAPETRGTCVLSGHTFYDTFDKARYQFQGPCKEILMAADCYWNTWDVKVSHRDVESYTEVEKVTIRKQSTVVDLIVDGKQVKVGGEDVSIPYSSENTSIYWQDGDILTTAILPEALVVKFNFKQLLVVHIRDPFDGKTCGICGNYNQDSTDDFFDAEGACALTPNPPGCTEEQKPEAERLCNSLFDTSIDEKCNVCYKPDRIARCMYEYCLRGQQGFCDHAWEFKKECYIKHGDTLEVPPECQ